MSKRFLHCHRCNANLGEKTSAGLKTESVILLPRQAFMCNRCKCLYKDVKISFAGSDAQTLGIAKALVAELDRPVPPGGMQWDVFKDLHDSGRLEMIPAPDGRSITLVAKADGGMAVRAAQEIVEKVIHNSDLSKDQKAEIFLRGLRSVVPEVVQEEKQEEEEAPQATQPSDDAVQSTKSETAEEMAAAVAVASGETSETSETSEETSEGKASRGKKRNR